MAKGKRNLAESANQLSLLDLLKEEQASRQEEPGTGSANVRDKLKEALSLSLKHALPKSRWEIAGDMSHRLGCEISKYQIDSWVCDSKEGHRIPAEYIPAFCMATGCYAALNVLTDTCKMFTVKGPDALRADIRKDEEAIKAKQREMKQKVALLSALEKRP
jgi:hypothetical protein